MNELEKYQPQEMFQDVDNLEAAPSAKEHPILDFIRLILRRWKLALLMFILISVVFSPLIWYFWRPIYTTRGFIHVKPVLSSLLTGAEDRGEISNYESYMNTQAMVMKSNRVLDRVTNTLSDRNLQIFGADVDLLMELKEALEDGKIVVAPSRRAEFLEISMKSRSPREAEWIVDAFLVEYTNVIQNTSVEGDSLDTLENRLDELSIEMDNHHKKLRELAKKFGDDSILGLQNVVYQNLTLLQTTLLDLEMRRLDIRARIQLYSQPQDPNFLPTEMINERNDFINNDPAVQQTNNTLRQLEQSLMVDQMELKEGHLDLAKKEDLIRKLQENLKQCREESGKEFDAIMANSQQQMNKNNLAQAQSELEIVEERLGVYREEQKQEIEKADDMAQTQFEINDKTRELNRDERYYNQIADRIYVLEMDSDRKSRISISDYANTGPPTTKRVKFLAALLFTALAGGLFFAFVLGKIDKNLYTPGDVIRCIGVPMIGTTCDLNQVEKKLIPERVAEDYHTIRANLWLISNKKIPHKLVITSAGMREGKSTFAVNLAISLAQAGKRVLLIDGDFRKPDLERLLNLPNVSWGIQDVLFGLRKFEETVRSVPLSGLDVLLANGSNSAEAIELLEKPQTAECINNISQKYDHVIIDTPPVLAVPDALLWAKMADAVVLSSIAGQTESPALQDALERLTAINVKVLGNVLGNVRTSAAYHRYSYGYGYGYGRGRDGGNGGKKSRRRWKESLMLSASEPDQNAKDRSNT